MALLSGQRRHVGLNAETLAVKFLRRKGMRLITRNYHCRHGEIDLIVRHGNLIVFVEVRFRSNRHFGTAIESVTAAKRSKIIYCARHFMMRNPRLNGHDIRFDIIGICHDERCQGFEIDWLENAFEPRI